MLSIEQKIENAIKWINGLSNTKLPQGTGTLGNKQIGFYCLGYACNRLNIPYDSFEEYEPSLVEYVGLKDEYGTIDNSLQIDDTFFDTLAELNDEAKLSFRRISTVIKNRAEDIFIKEVAEGVKKHFN